jgi:ABC-type uncharacterized transport system involved in gliding motility auxiliary subunit
MALRPHVILAVFKRNFFSYFSSVIGYLFIVAFVGLMAIAAFTAEFFADNQANLDHLNIQFPMILLFIIPAIAMTSWSEEKKQGTDELLFTLPALDLEILLGKYLAVLAIYTTALAFSFVFGTCVVLKLLTAKTWSPLDFDFDLGVVIANYCGYWVAGGALLAAGMVASVLTSSSTVAFIVGALICGIPIALGWLSSWNYVESLKYLGFQEHLRDFGLGLIPLTGLVFFGSLAAFMLYINLVLISKRHWSGGPLGPTMGGHFVVRTLCLAVALIGLNIITAGIFSYRVDLTRDRIYTIYPTTRKTLTSIDSRRPITIQAFISPKVPGEHSITRTNLIGLLRQFGQTAGNKVQVRLVDTDPASTAADEARGYGIRAEKVQNQNGGKISQEEIYMGCVVSSGSDKEVVIPFFDVGTPIEYELTRSIQTISRERLVESGDLTPEEAIRQIDPKRPIEIRAFVSAKVPEKMAKARDEMLEQLKKFEAGGGAKLKVTIVEPQPGSNEATTAVELGLLPRTLEEPKKTDAGADKSKGGEDLYFMGCVVQGVPSNNKTVVSAIDVGVTPKREIQKALVRVINGIPIKIGVLKTDLRIAGPDDSSENAMNPFEEPVSSWRIVSELRKQYSVQEVLPEGLIAANFDVLIAPLPSSLSSPHMTLFLEYVKQGKPTLIFDDPMPVMAGLQLAPRRPKPGPPSNNPFAPPPPSEPKDDGGKATRLMSLLNLNWNFESCVFDFYNPHPEFSQEVLSPEWVWVSDKSGAKPAFSGHSMITSGMQQMLLAFTGSIKEAKKTSDVEMTPLLMASPESGVLDWDQVFTESRDRIGRSRGLELNRKIQRVVQDPESKPLILAAHMQSKDGGDKVTKNAANGLKEKVNVIYVADIDFISDPMFAIVEKEMYGLKLDNVAFVLNCVDLLAGDDSLIGLRKRRPHQRTLSAVEAQTITYQQKRRAVQEEATKAAQEELDDVKKRLKAEQTKLTEDKTLDPTERNARMTMLVREEQTKLLKKEVEVETKKQAKLNQARNESTRQIQGVEFRYRLLAILLPPIPALLIGCWVFFKRMADERRSIGTDRLVAR